MIAPEILDAMVAAGCTAEQIVAAVKADAQADADKLARKRSADAERKRKQRANVTRTSCDIDGHGVTSTDSVDPPFSDKERSPTPPKEINSNPRETKRARGSRLPDDWALPAKWGQWALSEGWIEADIRFEAERFRDFWCSKAGKDATKIDWEATWRNWIRSAKGRLQQRPQPPPKPKSEFQRKHEEAIAVLTKSLGGNDERDSFHGATIDISAADFRAH